MIIPNGLVGPCTRGYGFWVDRFMREIVRARSAFTKTFEALSRWNS